MENLRVSDRVCGEPVEQVRTKALQNLDRYLQTPEEQLLRQHQVSVFEDLQGFLSAGETAGYVN